MDAKVDMSCGECLGQPHELGDSIFTLHYGPWLPCEDRDNGTQPRSQTGCATGAISALAAGWASRDIWGSTEQSQGTQMAGDAG